MFTYDLATAAFPRLIVALHPPDGPATYPAEVRHKIRRDEEADYAVAAASLNDSVADVVALQYEHGAWGGEDGEHVLAFLSALRLPVVSTLHAVPGRPTPAEQRVVTGIVRQSAATVVLSRAAAAQLATAYGVSAASLTVVPHGVPNLPLVDPDTVKPRLGLDKRHVILSFGLLRPGKGCEAVIDAMPAIVAADPSALYVILGATHSDLLAREGEAYREALTARAARLGVAASVRFEDRFMGRVELAGWVEAADVVVAPYLDLERVGSGTLSYAMGAGRAIVASPFAYALERLADGRGVIAETGSPAALAEAILGLLGDREGRDAYGRRAYEATRDQVWSAIGSAYERIFTRVARPSVLPPTPVRRFAPIGR